MWPCKGLDAILPFFSSANTYLSLSPALSMQLEPSLLH